MKTITAVHCEAIIKNINIKKSTHQLRNKIWEPNSQRTEMPGLKVIRHPTAKGRCGELSPAGNLER